MAEGFLIATRFGQFAGLLVLFGGSLFYLYAFERDGLPSGRFSWPHLIVLLAASCAVAGVLGWLMAETVLMTGEPHDALSMSTLWSVASQTSFGRVWSLRAVVSLSIIVICLRAPSKSLWMTIAVVSGVAVATLAWTGHGAMDEGWPGALHLTADILHLLAAALWIGALVPLAVLLVTSTRGHSEPSTAFHALSRFSGIGPAVVAVLVLTGVVNSLFLIGPSRWRALFEAGYGLVLLVKLGLFAGMILLAALNRFSLSAKLKSAMEGNGSEQSALSALRLSVITETLLAGLVLATVALLGTLEPPVALAQ